MQKDSSLVARMARTILQDYVESGVLAPGGRFPSIRDLNARYGASRTTIAEALGQLSAQGVLVKEHGRGCFLAEQLPSPERRTGPARTGLIGLVAPAPHTTEIMGRLHSGVEEAARRKGMQVVFSSHGGPEVEDFLGSEHAQVARLFETGCEAVILSPVARSMDQMEGDYLNREFLDETIVLVGQAMPYQNRPQIVFDNHRAGYEMTQLLLRAGHRRIAWLRGVPTGKERFRAAVKARHRGYLEALGEAGIQPRPQDAWEIRTGSPEDQFESPDLIADYLRRNWLDAEDRPTAAICPGDEAAVFVTHAARELGADVPGELCVAGFDNLAIGRGVWPPFPTTESPHAEAGRLAVDVSLRHVAGEQAESRIYVLPVQIMGRGAEERTASTREDIAARSVAARRKRT